MTMAICGEIPAVLTAFFLIDNKNFGRKRTLFIFLCLVAAFNLVIYFFELKYLPFFLFILRFCMKNVFSVLVPLTSELYPTLFRTLGYGYASGVGRIGAFVSAFALFPLFYISTYLPFIGLFIVSAFAAVACFYLPFDSTN